MRFIRVHALVHIFITGNASSDSLHISIAPFRIALLGVSWRGSFSYHMFKTTFWNVWNLPIFFYKVFHTLEICLRWILSRVQSLHSLEGSALFLRVLFFLNVSNSIGGGSKVVGNFL